MKRLYPGTALCLALLLPACGSSSSTGSTPVTTPPPPPCTQSIVFQGAGQLPPKIADFETFTTAGSGRVDVTLDWTLTSSTMFVFVAQPVCSFDQLKAGSCNLLLQIASPPKPLKGSVPNAVAGTYGLIIVNTSDNQESVSIQVVLSSGTCPAASSRPSRASTGDVAGAVGALGEKMTRALR